MESKIKTRINWSNQTRYKWKGIGKGFGKVKGIGKGFGKVKGIGKGFGKLKGKGLGKVKGKGLGKGKEKVKGKGNCKISYKNRYLEFTLNTNWVKTSKQSFVICFFLA